MASELLRELIQATAASSAAILILLLLRTTLRQRFGARLAYQAWLLVPVAMLAVWLPAPAATQGPEAGNVLVRLGEVALTTPVSPSVPVAWSLVALCAWILGGVAAVLWFALRQRHFTRRLSRQPGRAFDRVEGEGPALIGWWRPRIVLPEDFRERYTRGERRLVLAHEIAHLRSGDIHAQAFATALRCLFWFNPLVHIAAAAFRFDQELACDAAVLEKFPRARSRYGSAMLKTQLAVTGLPVGCHWQSSHPLKERIEMLKQPLPARTRKIAGSLSVAFLVAGASWAAWAAQPATATKAAAAAKQQQTAAKPAYLSSLTSQDVLTAPAYPKGAKEHGLVELELLVGDDGRIQEAKVVKSQPAGMYDQAALEATKGWYISPASMAKVSSGRRVRVPIEFRPDGAPKGE